MSKTPKSLNILVLLRWYGENMEIICEKCGTAVRLISQHWLGCNCSVKRISKYWREVKNETGINK
jgi:hypothetical protein